MKEWKCRVGVQVLTAIFLLGGILLFWTYVAEEQIHYTPDYPMEDITPLLEKDRLTEGEYELLYRQTGLSRIAVDILRKENRSEELLVAQERFFAEVEIDCECNFFVFRETLKMQESDVQEMQFSDEQAEVMPVLENGDILITFNTHFFGWRNGHAALVVDAENGRTLEAMTLGRDSAILSLKSWAERPSFVVLRLADASKEQRAEIATYAKETLTQIPYQLSAGIGEGIQRLLLQLFREEAKEAQAEDIGTKGVETKEAQAEDIGTKDVETKEAQAEDIGTKGVETKEAQVEDIGTKGVETKEAQAEDIGTKGVETKEALAEDIGTKDVETKEAQENDDRTGSGYTKIVGTQCAHLIWCAFREFGYNLDGDGGLIVTPKDLYESPLLEVIQVYGMKPE